MLLKCHINLSSGGGFITLPSSTREPDISCLLGLYVPRVARLLLAIIINIIIPENKTENISYSKTVKHVNQKMLNFLFIIVLPVPTA